MSQLTFANQSAQILQSSAEKIGISADDLVHLVFNNLERYLNTSELLSDAFIQLDANGNVLQHIEGQKEQNLFDLPILDLNLDQILSPTHVSIFREHLEKVSNSDTPTQFTLHTTNCQYQIHLHKSPDNTVWASISSKVITLEDFTLNHYKVILDHVPIPMAIRDTQTQKLIYANPSLCELSGYSTEELKTINTSELYVREQAQNHLNTTLNKNNLLKNWEVMFKRRDGSKINALATAHIIPFTNGEAILGGFIDISSLKILENNLRASEAMYHALVEHLPNTGLILFNDKRFLLAEGELFAQLLDKKTMPIVDGQLSKKFPLKFQTLITDLQTHQDATPFPLELQHKERDYLFNVVQIPSVEDHEAFTMLVIIDITERKAINKAEERSRIARDLHDSVSQTLFAATMTSESLLSYLSSGNKEELVKEGIIYVNDLAKNAMNEMRTMLVELRPNAIAESDLDELLNQLIGAFSGRSGIQATVSIPKNCQLPPEVQEVIYRVTQESLNNILKHSKASHVSVELKCNRFLQLTINDNGIGFNTAQKSGGHYGLTIMKERARKVGASLSIKSAPTYGTTVQLRYFNPPSRRYKT